jgi:hypothetical protein
MKEYQQKSRVTNSAFDKFFSMWLAMQSNSPSKERSSFDANCNHLIVLALYVTTRP